MQTGNGSVATEQGEYTPPQIDPNQEATFINIIIRDSTKSTTHQAMEIMYHGMRQQAFWDGNKRTATLLANKLMIDNGAGLINVPLDKWETWSNLIANFYFSGNNDQLLTWTYQNGIQGVDLTKNKPITFEKHRER